MAIEVQCPSCQSRMRVAEEMAGRVGKCPKCHGRIAVPGAPSKSGIAPTAKPAAASPSPSGIATATPAGAAPPKKTPPPMPRAKPVPQQPTQQPTQPSAQPGPPPRDYQQAYPQPQPSAPMVARAVPAAMPAGMPQQNYGEYYGGAPMQAIPFPPTTAAPGFGGFPSVGEGPATKSRVSSAVGIRRGKSILSWYRIWLGSFILTFVAMFTLVGMAMAVAGAQSKIDTAMRNYHMTGDLSYMEAVDQKSLLELSGIPISVFFTVLGLLPLTVLVQVVALFVLLYQMWDVIQDGVTTTSPGAAVGLMFVPLFNIYWMFVAIGGLPGNLNRFAGRHHLIAPRASEGLAITWCIFSFLPGLSLANVVIMPLAFGNMAKTAAKLAQQA